ncbi:hypothetical protein EBESD8_36970 [Rhodococcus aetherivorans]|nr:hypothetical protein EBESD8_36970 [Rhodococcus aetherivorans]
MKLPVCAADRGGFCGQTTGPYTMTPVTIECRRDPGEFRPRG